MIFSIISPGLGMCGKYESTLAVRFRVHICGFSASSAVALPITPPHTVLLGSYLYCQMDFYKAFKWHLFILTCSIITKVDNHPQSLQNQRWTRLSLPYARRQSLLCWCSCGTPCNSWLGMEITHHMACQFNKGQAALTCFHWLPNFQFPFDFYVWLILL